MHALLLVGALVTVAANPASTDWAPFMGTVHVELVPLHAPFHPVKVYP